MDMMLRQQKDRDRTSVKDRGLVSVIMPNYNGQRYLDQTIRSVLSQTYENWELILVDDCSTDASIEIASQYGDDRIKVVRNEKNDGAARSRNRAIELANGRWIAFLDSDDVWREDKLERHLAFMEEGQHAFSFTSYDVVDGQGELITCFAPKKDTYDYKTILKHSYIGCSTVIYDREQLGKVYMPPEADKREDFVCWLSILKTGINGACLHEALTAYRVHGSGVSSNKWKMVGLQWAVYRKIEKLSFVRCLYYMAHWAVRGFLKYR